MSTPDTAPVKDQSQAAQSIRPDQPHSGLTIMEASKRLGRTPDTIRRWIAAGKLRAEVVQRPQGKAYRVYLDELEAEPSSIEGDEPETDHARVEEGVPTGVDDTDQVAHQDPAPQAIDPNNHSRGSRPQRPASAWDAARSRFVSGSPRASCAPRWSSARTAKPIGSTWTRRTWRR